jgi:transcriptional regulator with XRE-family HTH domain
MKLGRVLNGHRRITGQTLDELAAEIGITRAALNRIEKGVGHPHGAALARVLIWLVEPLYEVRDGEK